MTKASSKKGKKKRKRSPNQQMTCNYCGGQMFQSGLKSGITVCYECGMRHDWTVIIEHEQKKARP